MGKKKAVSGAELPGKTRVELRFDTEVYEGIREKAEAAGISVNQLMHGLAKWAVKELKLGEPDKDGDGWIRGTREQAGCLWAGDVGQKEHLSPEQVMEAKRRWMEEMDEPPETWPGPDDNRDMNRKGRVWVFLDYTERRVLRDDV